MQYILSYFPFPNLPSSPPPCPSPNFVFFLKRKQKYKHRHKQTNKQKQHTKEKNYPREQTMESTSYLPIISEHSRECGFHPTV